MLRMIRFKVRLGYAIDERTKLQYENAREAEMLTRITPEALGAELRHIAKEPNSGGSDARAGRREAARVVFARAGRPKPMRPVSTKLQKARQLAPFGWDLRIELPAAVSERAAGEAERQGAAGAGQGRGAGQSRSRARGRNWRRRRRSWSAT